MCPSFERSGANVDEYPITYKANDACSEEAEWTGVTRSTVQYQLIPAEDMEAAIEGCEVFSQSGNAQSGVNTRN